MKPPVIGLNGVEWVYQKVSSLEGPGINLTGINKTWNPRTQPPPHCGEGGSERRRSAPLVAQLRSRRRPAVG